MSASSGGGPLSGASAQAEPSGAVRRRRPVPCARSRLPRSLDRLSHDPDDHPELLRPKRRHVRRARQLPEALQRRHAPHGAQEQLPLDPGRPGFRDGDRAHLRRPPRAGALRNRFQGRGLHAHGDLAVRGGRHLATDVREGPRPGHGQRRGRGREGRGEALRGPLGGATRRRTGFRVGRRVGSSSRRHSSPAASRSSV